MPQIHKLKHGRVWVRTEINIIYAPQVKLNNILKRLEKDKFSFTIYLL